MQQQVCSAYRRGFTTGNTVEANTSSLSERNAALRMVPGGWDRQYGIDEVGRKYENRNMRNVMSGQADARMSHSMTPVRTVAGT